MRESGESTVLPPSMSGVLRSFGGIEITGAVTSEFCDAEPSEFDAVTWTRRRQPTSGAVGV